MNTRNESHDRLLSVLKEKDKHRGIEQGQGQKNKAQRKRRQKMVLHSLEDAFWILWIHHDAVNRVAERGVRLPKGQVCFLRSTPTADQSLSIGS